MSRDNLEPVIATELPTGIRQFSEETLLSLSGDMLAASPAIDRQSSL